MARKSVNRGVKHYESGVMSPVLDLLGRLLACSFLFSTAGF